MNSFCKNGWSGLWLSCLLLTTQFSIVSAQSTAASAAKAHLPDSIKQFFVGCWKGSGHFATGRALSSTLCFQFVASGEAVQFTSHEEAPNTFAYSALLSYDTPAGTPVLMMAANNSGGARLFRSTGLEEGTIAFTSSQSLHAWFGFERLTFHRVDEGHLSVLYEFSQDGQSWKTGDEQSFVSESAG